MAKLDRRDFMVLGAAAGTAAACPSLVSGMELNLGGNDFHQIRTFHPRDRKPYLCTMCPFFDGGFTYSENGQVLKAEGNPDHFATRGKFCAKGLASFFAADDPDRILTPLKRVGACGSGKWRQIGWNEAIALVAGKVRDALPDPDSITFNEGAFKDGGGARLMNTLGSKSMIRSRLPFISCAAKYTALEQALGVNFVLPDLEHTSYVLNFGANIMETAFPLAQRLTDGIVNSRLKLVTLDVRMSNTAGRSDVWIPVYPGSDGIIALAMAGEILRAGLADRSFIDTWTDTTADKLAGQLKEFTLERAAEASGVEAGTIAKIAREFATIKPATVFSLNSVGWHRNGIDAEAATLLLAVITGNIDNRGGYCLPRKYDLAQPKPAPAGGSETRLGYNYKFPFESKTGARSVKVLFNHMANPAYTAPASSLWREVLADEKLVPFIVDFSPFMSETAELADVILPDVVNVERHDLASAPSAMLPWASMTVPPVKPRGKALDARETMKKIVEAIDPDGSRKMKPYWAFANTKQWVKLQVEATPGLEKIYKKLRRSGLWPRYGKIDPATRQIIKQGKPVPIPYGTYKRTGFATKSGKIQIRRPKWIGSQNLSNLKPNQFALVTFKMAFHTLSQTTNLKYLAELAHSNPLWINIKVAHQLGIADGGLVRVTSAVGHLVTKAWLTQGIQPKAVGIATSVGRQAYGRVARADANERASFALRKDADEDIEDNLWWRDKGVSANDIIPIALDGESGAQMWSDTVVTVAPAEKGDRYGDIKVDNAKHMAIFKRMLGDG